MIPFFVATEERRRGAPSLERSGREMVLGFSCVGVVSFSCPLLLCDGKYASTRLKSNDGQERVRRSTIIPLFGAVLTKWTAPLQRGRGCRSKIRVIPR